MWPPSRYWVPFQLLSLVKFLLATVQTDFRSSTKYGYIYGIEPDDVQPWTFTVDGQRCGCNSLYCLWKKEEQMIRAIADSLKKSTHLTNPERIEGIPLQVWGNI